VKNLSITLEDEDEDKLGRIVESGEAANISHAVRRCIRAYPEPVKAKVRVPK